MAQTDPDDARRARRPAARRAGRRRPRRRRRRSRRPPPDPCRGTRRRGRAARAGIHRAPQAKVERAAEREAQPEHDGDRDHDRRRRQDEEQRRARPRRAPRISASWRGDRGPNRPANTPEQVGDERRRREGRQPDRLEAAAPGDRRQQRLTRAIVTPTPTAATQVEGEIAPDRALRDAWRSDGRNTTYLEAARSACEVSCRARRGFAVAVVRDSPRRVGPPSSRGGSAMPTIPAGRDSAMGRRPGSPGRSCRKPIRGPTAPRGGLGPVGMCGFDRAWLPGNASRGCCSGLVNQAAKRSTWQPPVDSRPRCLGSKVSVEATSAPRVVEASFSGAAIRTSVT